MSPILANLPATHKLHHPNVLPPLLLLNGGSSPKRTATKIIGDLLNMGVEVRYFLAQTIAPHISASVRVISFRSSLMDRAVGFARCLLHQVPGRNRAGGMARTLAKNLGSRGVTGNCVSLGPTGVDLSYAGESQVIVHTIARWAHTGHRHIELGVRRRWQKWWASRRGGGCVD